MRIALADIGGTAVKTALWTGAEEGGGRPVLSDFGERRTCSEGGEGILSQLVEMLSALAPLDGVGVATAGQVDPASGSIRYANPNIPNYTGLPLRDALETRLCVPVAVENDVNAAALGEGHFGAGRPFRRFLCLTFGTGIGGAIVLDGGLERGANGAAGEFGMMLTHAERSDPGDCLSGCYETYASAAALVREARRLDPELDSGRAVLARWDEPQVAAIVDRWQDEAALGLVGLIHAFDPEAVLLGGGVMERDGVAEGIRDKARARVMSSFRGVQILPCALGNAAGLCGALLAAWDRMKFS